MFTVPAEYEAEHIRDPLVMYRLQQFRCQYSRPDKHSLIMQMAYVLISAHAAGNDRSCLCALRELEQSVQASGVPGMSVR